MSRHRNIRPPDESNVPKGGMAPHDAATMSPAQRAGSDRRHPSATDVRFVAGTMLGARFRIVGLLGKGGMGEVYRADDLKLGQSVALKFLPLDLANDPRWLRRFQDEVRVAREVSHPNVCRTYDIGEVHGEHFIAMEYVDGEDLGALIKRIGRLPKDKALQIARQLCAGIAAAHDKGVLHRDLKPSNIMLDGRGRVRITDFGLAALADSIKDHDIRAGTPAFMAPEQLAGEEVTERSDIYSLGLVMYEVFTGREAFGPDAPPAGRKARRSTTPTTPSTLIEDMDPIVERVILRCLEDDPKDRPRSAIAVAAALPGGDPLAMALAAGETPSPEMVAEAGEAGGLKPPVAVALLIAFIAFAVLAMVFIDRGNLFRRVSMEKPPAVLRDRALTILRDLGYSDPPGDVVGWFRKDAAPMVHVARTLDRPDPWAPLDGVELPLIQFDMRTSPEPMARLSWSARIDWRRPPFDQPGMTRMTLDMQGNLLRFDAAPNVASAGDSSVEADDARIDDEPDLSAVFESMGLAESGFTSIAPDFEPTVHCDQLAAWSGAWPGAREIPLEIQAGFRHGRLAFLRMKGPWTDIEGRGPEPGIFALAATLIIGIAMLFMFRNLRTGRGDRTGAFRLALIIFVIAMVRWLCASDHVSTPVEFDLLFRAFGVSCGLAVLTWALYLAAEPYARRFLPQTLISWARLLSGRLRDPRVGRDLLIGALAGAATLCVPYAPFWPDPDPHAPILPGAISGDPDTLLGGRHLLAQLADALIEAFPIAFGLLVLLLILRVLLRRTLPAGIAFVAIFVGVLFVSASPIPWPALVVWIIMSSTFAFLIIRFGLLAVIAMIFAWDSIERFAATLDFSQWYAPQLLAGPLAVLLVAVYGFWISLAGRPLFKDSLAHAR